MPFYTSDSLAPKRLLAYNFKQMVVSIGFEQVIISDLCEQSNMESKDFTHHFKSKFDLVRWIYNSEFYNSVYIKKYVSEYEFFRAFSRYLESNHEYYKALFSCKIDLIQSHIAEGFEDVLRIFRGTNKARTLTQECMIVLEQIVLGQDIEANGIYNCLVSILAEDTVE